MTTKTQLNSVAKSIWRYLADNHSIPPRGLTRNRLGPNLAPIDVNPFPRKGMKSKATATATALPFWQVETLLNQASDLLERVLSERDAYDSMRSYVTLFKLNLALESKTLSIRDTDLAQGSATVARIRSEAEVAKLGAVITRSKAQQAMIVSRFGGDVPSNAPTAGALPVFGVKGLNEDKLYDFRQAEAKTQLRPTNNSNDDRGGDPFYKTGEHAVVNAPQGYTREGVVNDAVYQNTWRDIAIQRSSEWIQSLQSAMAQESSQVASDCEKKLKPIFQRLESSANERQEAAVANNTLKHYLMATDGAPLNYEHRLASLRERAMNDFSLYAYPRLMAASNGLACIFNYQPALPTMKDWHNNLDEVIKWVRDAINFVNLHSVTDQVAIVPVSLLNMLGAAEWATMIGELAAVGVSERELDLSSLSYAVATDVRMRGARIYAEQSQTIAPWAVELRAPDDGVFKHSDGSVTTMDQRSVPSVQAGKVLPRNHPRPAELVGGGTFYNISPIGKKTGKLASPWTIRVRVPFGMMSYAASLADIQIDLHIVYKE